VLTRIFGCFEYLT